MKFELQTNIDNDPNRGRLVANYVAVSKLGSMAKGTAVLDIDLSKPSEAILVAVEWVLRIRQIDIPEPHMPPGEIVKVPLPRNLDRRDHIGGAMNPKNVDEARALPEVSDFPFDQPFGPLGGLGSNDIILFVDSDGATKEVVETPNGPAKRRIYL